MYVLNAHIEIGGKRFTRVHFVEIESSAKVIENTAKIVLPATARLERSGVFISEVETAKVFNVGDIVKIGLGYDGNTYEAFEGYVSRIKPGVPLEVECLDATWLLRRKNVKKSFRTVTLKSLIEYIIEGTGINLTGDVPELSISPFYLKNVTAASALQEIKERYGLVMYLRDNMLNVGLTSYTDNVVVKYGLGVNVIDNDLEWVSESDTRIKVKAVHIRANGTRVEKDVGDFDGESRTLYFYNLEKGADLETVALQALEKTKYSGFKGGMNTFLIPSVQVGNVARVSDPQFGERSGDYLVDKVTTRFGTDGARRKVELGLKLSING